jgi:tetratricopeptide (TPR) repeat protein
MSQKLPAIASTSSANSFQKSGKLGWLRRVETGADGGQGEPNCLPALDVPQRASTPWEYATPQRTTDLDLPPDVSKAKMWSTAPMPVNYVRRVRKRAQKENARFMGGWKKQVADLKMLADSASRAGDLGAAMRLYHKMGVIYDNAERYDDAVKMYEQYLQLCQNTKDLAGEQLAYNCLGIDYYKLGNLDLALTMHTKHLEAADPAGKFVAHSNLGLCYHNLKMNEHASIHHQHAIEWATRLGIKAGQQIAVGNLGMVSYSQGDLSTSRVCLKYHLAMQRASEEAPSTDGQMSHGSLQRLTAAQSELRTHKQLGQVSCAEGRLDEASSHLARSIELSRQTKNHQEEEKCSVLLGVVQGLMGFDEHKQKLADQTMRAKVGGLPALGS